MTVLASTIINKAALILQDQNNVKWPRSELLEYINDAQRQIVTMATDSTNKVGVIKLVAGTRQELPSDGWTLLKVIRYMGTDGLKPGRAIRLASKEMIDAYNPDWHNDAKTVMPKHYIFDEQDQTVFYVYPPNNGNGYVQINYSFVPPVLSDEASSLALNDIFQTAILDYVLFRACAKQAPYSPGKDVAAAYLQTFMAAIQVKSQSEVSNSPNQQFGPRNPSVPGAES